MQKCVQKVYVMHTKVKVSPDINKKLICTVQHVHKSGTALMYTKSIQYVPNKLANNNTFSLQHMGIHMHESHKVAN